jgi:ABC-type xylose transport system permease subunit
MGAAILLETGGLFIGLLACIAIGWRYRRRRQRLGREDANAGLGVVEGAVFGLLGLLLAFTFSGASSRFEARKSLIVQETNAIGTAWERIDLLPAETQPDLRAAFRSYVDRRLEAARVITDTRAYPAAQARCVEMERVIWTQVVAACRRPDAGSASVVVVPAVNEMSDIAERRAAALEDHPPAVIFIMLHALALIGGLFVGYSLSTSRHVNWLYVLGYVMVISFAVYVIRDLEYPREGFIRMSSSDHWFQDLREGIK